jgi:hypothetical protein
VSTTSIVARYLHERLTSSSISLDDKIKMAARIRQLESPSVQRRDVLDDTDDDTGPDDQRRAEQRATRIHGRARRTGESLSDFLRQAIAKVSTQLGIHARQASETLLVRMTLEDLSDDDEPKLDSHTHTHTHERYDMSDDSDPVTRAIKNRAIKNANRWRQPLGVQVRTDAATPAPAAPISADEARRRRNERLANAWKQPLNGGNPFGGGNGNSAA